MKHILLISYIGSFALLTACETNTAKSWKRALDNTARNTGERLGK